MRPDPQHRRDSSNSGRIIYIGDVKRRRAADNRAPDRYYLAALVLVAAMSWGAWLAVIMSLAPSRLLSYVAFFVPLAVALTSTLTIVLYGFTSWRQGYPRLATSFRRALLITAVVEVNLGFLGARLWLLPVAAGTITAAVLAEITFSARGY